MVDGAYQLIAERLKPGVRESELVAERHAGSCSTWARSTSTTSTRCRASAAARTRTSSATGSSAPATRPSSTSSRRSSATRPATTARSRSAWRRDAQRDAYKRAREWIDASIELMRPGVDDRPGRRASGRRPRSSGSSSEMECFGLQFGHSVGPVPARAADHQPAQLARPSGRDQGGHGHRARDVLPGQGRLLGGADRGGGRGHRRRPAGHHASSRATSCSSRTRTDPTPMATVERRPRIARPRDRPRGCTGRWSSAGCFEDARPGAVLRGPRPRHDPPRDRPGGGRGRLRRGDARRRLHVLHVPRPQPHPRPRRADGARSSPSCSAGRPGCSAARAARCTSPASSTA